MDIGYRVLSLNCHRFNDGIALYFLRVAVDVDIILCKRHGFLQQIIKKHNFRALVTALPCYGALEIVVFECILPDYIVYHSSSMEDRIQNNILHGRPYGGTSVPVRKRSELNCFRVVTDNPRTCITSVCLKNANGADAISSSIYMSWCDQSMDQIADYEDTIGCMQSIIDRHIGCSFIFGGDLNVSKLLPGICGRHVVNFCVANDILWLSSGNDPLDYTYHSIIVCWIISYVPLRGCRE